MSALLQALALAAASAGGDEGVAFARLENGLHVGFALVRTGLAPGAGELEQVAPARSNAVSRVLMDRETGAFFGYRLVAQRASAGRVRVSLEPLPEGIEAELRARPPSVDCPQPTRLAADAPRFPEPQLTTEGEALSLELLANPDTAERILDVVLVSSRPISAETMRAAAARTLEAWRASQRASSHVARREYHKAAAEYRAALRLRPNDAGLHNRLGVALQRQGEQAQAQREYETALELAPGYASAWNNLGTLEHARRRYKQAARAYRKAVELKPRLATAWMNLGAADLALGRVEEGLDAYRQAFALDPAVFESRTGTVASGVDPGDQSYYIAKVLAASGQAEPALEFLLKARASGFRDWDRVRRDPDFQLLKHDARFQQLLRGGLDAR